MKTIQLLFTILVGMFLVNAQNIDLREETKTVVRNSCEICKQKKGGASNRIFQKKAFINYHNFHIYAINNQFKKAFNLSHDIKTNDSISLCMLEYLKGYMFMRKNLYKMAEKHFLKSLSYKGNTYIRGNSRLSLALLFQEKKNFESL